MKKRYVISRDALPAPVRIHALVAYYLLLEHLGAPGWLYGVCGTMGIIFIAVAVVQANTCITVNPFEPEDGQNEPEGKTRWQRRMEALQEEQRKRKPTA